MEKLVIYVRHAESESNAVIHNSRKNNRKKLTDSQEDKINSYHDPNITPHGIKQSEQTAYNLLSTLKIMNKKKINIWMSPFQRAQDTAKYFIDSCNKEELSVKVSVMLELQEYTSSKKPITDEQLKSGIIIHDTMEMFIDQIMKFNDTLKKELIDQDDDSILIIFGHSMFFSTLMSYHIIHELYKPIEIPSLRLPNCSISCEAYFPDKLKWKSYVVASTSHLPKELVTGNHVPFGIN